MSTKKQWCWFRPTDSIMASNMVNGRSLLLTLSVMYLKIQIAKSSIFETRQSAYRLVTLREVISLAFATLLTYSSSSADKFSAAIRILTLREKCDRGV